MVVQSENERELAEGSEELKVVTSCDD